MWVYCFNKSCK